MAIRVPKAIDPHGATPEIILNGRGETLGFWLPTPSHDGVAFFSPGKKLAWNVWLRDDGVQAAIFDSGEMRLAIKNDAAEGLKITVLDAEGEPQWIIHVDEKGDPRLSRF